MGFLDDLTLSIFDTPSPKATSSEELPLVFRGLNPEQHKGVQTTYGPVLVIAGAGSGKTKMLTARIYHLMTELKVEGRNILAVTFTNKAAGEMRHRLGSALGLEESWSNSLPTYFHTVSRAPHIGTFHSICVRLLRQEIVHLPFTRPFVIYDDSDQLTLVKDCMRQLDICEKSFSPRGIQWGINQAKCSAQEPKDLTDGNLDYNARILKKVYELYQKELFKNSAIDFGEIITMTYRLLRDNPQILEKYQDQYQFIHVDEYQDTNRAQYLLIKLLAAKHQNLFVVGDEDQSIYKWRGADIRNILDFEKDYPQSVTIKLEQNYRSTQTIIEASSKLISKNSERKDKKLWTENELGEAIERFQLSDDRAEAELVVQQIKKLCAEDGFSFNDVAVFYRTNAQSRVLEDILRRERAPYKVVGGLRFYDRKEIKDVLAYFRVLCNENDSVSFRRIINVPQRSIGKTTVEKIEAFAFDKGFTFEQGLREIINSGDLTAAPKRKIQEFIKLTDDLKALLKTSTLSQFYHELMDRTGYLQELKTEGTEEAQSRVENLQEFDSILIDFEKDLPEVKNADQVLEAFLENVSLASDEKGDLESTIGNVSLMTLHTSKGLEFPVVFMVGLEEGLFPSMRKSEGEASDEDVEEERRLCYVGMTRARQRLYMTHVVCRRVYGNIQYHDPARFFNEIPEELIRFTNLARFKSESPPSYGADADYDHWSSTKKGKPYVEFSTSYRGTSPLIGKKVKHSTYGVGMIQAAEGTDENTKVTVQFPSSGTKKLVLKYANLEFLK